MTDHRIVDADCHILEPPDIWENWLPERHRDKAPRLVRDSQGGDAWLTGVGGDPDPIGLTATPGMPFDEFRWFGVTYEEARTGCYNGAARLEDMDLDGGWARVLFPPQRTMSHFLGDEDDDFVLAGIEAYNNFLFDEFMAPDPTRLIGRAQIPALGPAVASETMRKAKARGFKGVVISMGPSGGGSISDDDDPFWAAAADEGMPVCIHINLISRKTRQRQRAAAAKAAEKGVHGERGVYGGKAAKANAKAVAGLGGVFATVPSTIGQLIFTGVFERFPELHVSMIETGVGWIGHFLEQIEHRYWRHRPWGNIPIQEPPSFYWYRNMSATFIWDKIGLTTRHAVGIDNI